MKKAVILLNMGGASNNDEIKMFLTNMFNDKNIISLPNPFRKLLAFIITKSRLSHAIENYSKIGGKSPILNHTQNLAKKLQEKFSDIKIEFVMRYTPPRAAEVLARLKTQKIEEIFLLPLYPQYSTTTTKSSFEDMEETLKKLNYAPKIKKIDRFYKNELFCNVILENIKKTLGKDEANQFDLIFSAHSLPQKIIDKGDTYQKEIEENVLILSDKLKKNGINFKNISIAYQSKLGPVKWLEPSLESVLLKMQNKKVIIYPLSFTLDNSETDFELSIEYKEVAKENGFLDYRVCPCPNDNDLFILALEDIIKKTL